MFDSQRSSRETSEQNALKAIGVLLNHLDFQGCIHDKEYWRGLASLNPSIKNAARTAMFNFFKCNLCQNRGRLTECGKRLCVDCASTCQCKNCRKVDSNNLEILECLQCNRALNLDNFLQTDCKHLCDLCVFQSLSINGMIQCKICNSTLHSKNSSRFNCSKCRNNYNGHEIFGLNCGHLYCVGCAQSIIKDKFCDRCNKTLLSADLLMLSHPLMVFCSVCENACELTTTKRYSCCYQNVCIKCQDSTICGFCRQALNYIE